MLTSRHARRRPLSLESLESRLTPANTFSTATYIHEVVTNTQLDEEVYATRVFAPGPGEDFDVTLDVAYDPENPEIMAAVADAVASAAAAYPTRTIEVVTSSTILLGGAAGDFPQRTYPHTFRILSNDDTTQVAVGASDSFLSTDVIVIHGPATVPTGLEGGTPLFVPAGDVHTSTITHLRREVASTTTRTYTTTQFVVAAPIIPEGGGGVTTFSVSSRTKPEFVLESAAAPAEESQATRIVGTFNGVQFDTTLNLAYDPSNTTIQTAIAAAREAVRGAGAISTSTAIGSGVRGRIDVDTSSADQVETSEYEDPSFAPITEPGGIYQVAPPVAGETTMDPEGPAINYIGSAVILVGDETSQPFFVSYGDSNVDFFSERTRTTTRTRTVTETYLTTTTIQVIGGDHVHLRAVGADAGGGPHVKAFTVDGEVAFNAFVYEPSFIGGVRVATGDVNNDGVDDIATAAGDGGGPRIQIFDGATGQVLRNFMAFPDTLRVGVFVSLADVNGDGFADYAVTPGTGGGPRVALFDGATGERIGDDFFAFDESDRHGITVALSESGFAIGQFGGGSQVKLFDLSGNLISEFAFASGFTGGVNLADDPAGGYVLGAGPGGGPLVKRVTDEGALVEEFFAADEAIRTGVRVGSVETAFGPALAIAVDGAIRTADGEFFPAFDDPLAVWVS